VKDQIIRKYLEGSNFTQIARQLHRDRRAVANICKALNIEAQLEAQRQYLVGESWKWRESIMFTVENEANAEVAMRLAQAFGMVPPPRRRN
jgi:plasmid maintenance system antidote protein VapI